MHSFDELLLEFEDFFSSHRFPEQPTTLYEPCSYLLHMGGKRIRPVLCLMSYELFADLNQNAWNTAMAIELFHNFTLMHDDIMDKAPLRRGQKTVHEKYSVPTAILSGDVMNIFAYEHLNKVDSQHIHSVIQFFNKTAIEICEGQQLDMDYEKKEAVEMSEYLHMITLKTSVLLGTSMKLGAMLGGATDGCSTILYQFGKSLGLAFQLMDDYLDVYGDANKTGKQNGGDILSDKKTFLSTKAFALASLEQRHELANYKSLPSDEKVQKTKALFSTLEVDKLLKKEIENYSEQAFAFLEKAPILSKRKVYLHALAKKLLHREH